MNGVYGQWGQSVNLAHFFTLVAKLRDLATPILRREAELRAEGRDCMEQLRRRVRTMTPDDANVS